MPLPQHLFLSDTDGALYDTRTPDWSKNAPLRANYSRHHQQIGSVADLKATLRSGGFAWPGGYPLYFVMSDGEALSFTTAKKEFRLLAEAIMDDDRHSGWRVVGCDVNYEDNDLYDAHSGERIEAAYPNDEEPVAQPAEEPVPGRR